MSQKTVGLMISAIGEFISSVVIVITLIVLVYEIRSSKEATLRNNALKRQRKQDDLIRSLVEHPRLSYIMVNTSQHFGQSYDVAADFGLNPEEYWLKSRQYMRQLAQWRDGLDSDLSPEESKRLLKVIQTSAASPVFDKW